MPGRTDSWLTDSWHRLQGVGLPRSHPLLSAIRDFGRFPFSRRWIRSTRAKLLSLAREQG